MKKIILLVAASLALAFCLAGCSSQSVSYGVALGKVSVQDKTLTVDLKSTPSTGYEWTAQIEGDNATLKSDVYTDAKSDKPVNGASGMHTFIFEGKDTGESTIVFEYARSFETAAPVETVTIDLKTNGGTITKTVTKCSDGSGGQSSK